MGAVEVGRTVRATQVERVVAVVEQTKSALFIERVRPGVGHAKLEAVAHALVHVDLQSVIGIDASSLVGDRFSRVSNIRNAKVDVAAFIVGQVGGAIGQLLSVVVGVADGVAVAVILLIGATGERRAGRRSDTGLVEGDRDDLMPAAIADEADLDRQIVARLPLDVKSVVEGVRQLVGAVVYAQRNGLSVVEDTCCVGQIVG